MDDMTPGVIALNEAARRMFNDGEICKDAELKTIAAHILAFTYEWLGARGIDDVILQCPQARALRRQVRRNRKWNKLRLLPEISME